MLRTIVDTRAVMAMVIAAGIGAWGLHTYPVQTDDVFLALIELRKPVVFQALAYGYATLWLHELSKRHRRTYETQSTDVRNLHVAHNVLVDASARWAMFKKTRIRAFEKLIAFLNQLHDVLREMYQNGPRPTLRPMPYSVRSLVEKKLKDLRENPTHQRIVAETRMCMTLITQAAKALPNASRRALRWG